MRRCRSAAIRSDDRPSPRVCRHVFPTSDSSFLNTCDAGYRSGSAGSNFTLDPTSYTLFVVPALGAVLIGRFNSFWITALAGLLLGVVQSELIKLQTGTISPGK